ncbi:MAG: hypothetical protein MZV64_40160 [Ignavibacteriales bacterium]|nr:hypothetical protein [Ignavibacteriales bacterium]
MAPVPFSTVCFRFNPGNLSEDDLNRVNEMLLEKLINQEKYFYRIQNLTASL